MEGILKVSSEQLISTANEFSGIGSTVRNLTSSMTDTVNGLSSLWEGDAATAYMSKFNGLQDDIERLNGMIQEHSKDLIEMANLYANAETGSVNEIESLSSDVIV
jgi:WXG100 family type VII secretion target